MMKTNIPMLIKYVLAVLMIHVKHRSTMISKIMMRDVQ